MIMNQNSHYRYQQAQGAYSDGHHAHAMRVSVQFLSYFHQFLGDSYLQHVAHHIGNYSRLLPTRRLPCACEDYKISFQVRPSP
jgi:hypothetical protein